MKKTEGALLKKGLQINKHLHNEIGSENLIIFNFAKIGNVYMDIILSKANYLYSFLL